MLSWAVFLFQVALAGVAHLTYIQWTAVLESSRKPLHIWSLGTPPSDLCVASLGFLTRMVFSGRRWKLPEFLEAGPVTMVKASRKAKLEAG